MDSCSGGVQWKDTELLDHIIILAGCFSTIKKTPQDYVTVCVCKRIQNVTRAQGNITKMSQS